MSLNKMAKKITTACILYAFIVFFYTVSVFFFIPFNVLIAINVFGILPYFIKKYLNKKVNGELHLEKVDYYFLFYPLVSLIYLWTYLIGWQFILYDFLSPLLKPIGEPLRIFMRNYVGG